MALSVVRQKREQRVEPQRAVEPPGVLVQRLAHIGVFLARAGEQLHGQDVGVAVDDAAGQHRARLPTSPWSGRACAARTRAAARGSRRTTARPAARATGSARAEQQQRAGAVDQDVPDAGDQRDDGLADRRAGLHHAVGDAAGEIVLEERPGLAHHVPVVLPADAVRHVGGDRLVGEQVLRRDRERAQRPAAPAPCRAAAASARRTASSGFALVTSVTTRPMKIGIIVSSSATTKPATNSAANSRFACRAKCQ